MQTGDVGLFGVRLPGSAFAVQASVLFMARNVQDREMSRAIAAGVAWGVISSAFSSHSGAS